MMRCMPIAGLVLLMTAQLSFAQSGWLADNANVLSDAEEQSLRQKIAEVEQATHVHVCVRTIANANGETLKDISVRTLNEWNPGTRSVLILACLEPRKHFVQPSTDLKYVFDGDVSSGICRNTVAPLTHQGRYAEGLLAGIEAVRLHVVAPEAYHARTPFMQREFLGLTGWTWLIILIAVVVLVVIVWSARRSTGSSGDSSFFWFDSGGGGFDFGSCDGGGGGGD